MSVAPRASEYGLFGHRMGGKLDRGDVGGRAAERNGRHAGAVVVDHNACTSTIHVDHEFPVDGRWPDPTGRRHGGSAGPVPHASVIPTPRSWTRIVIECGVRTGGDDLEVDVRQGGTEGGEVDGVEVVDGDDGVRVADAEVGGGPRRIDAEGAPAGGAAMSVTLPMDAVATIGGRVVGWLRGRRGEARHR